MTLKDILSEKAQKEVIGVTPATSIREAMETIVRDRIGALVVRTDKDELVGIITERDIFWHIFKEGEPALQKKVEEIMTRDVVVGIPEDKTETAESFMTTNRFRHLPVMQGNKVVGIISIGDLVKSQLGNLKVENRYLKDYITGKYPA
jgi:CBS domain-containing protein